MRIAFCGNAFRLYQKYKNLQIIMQKILPRSGLVQQSLQRGPAKEPAGRLSAGRKKSKYIKIVEIVCCKY
jgi:hypothetical protein